MAMERRKTEERKRATTERGWKGGLKKKKKEGEGCGAAANKKNVFLCFARDR